MWMRILMLLCVTILTVSPSWAVSVQIDDGDQITPIADVTVTGSATLVSAANSNRAALNCTNTNSSINVRWGSSAVTSSTGQQLRATSSIEIRDTAAIYMISESTNVTVSCTEEVR